MSHNETVIQVIMKQLLHIVLISSIAIHTYWMMMMMMIDSGKSKFSKYLFV